MRRSFFLALAFGIAAVLLQAQDPGPVHLQDPTLILDRSGEGQTHLVLPKGLTSLTFSAERRQGDDRHDEDGSPFHSRDRRFPDFRYAVLNMGFGLPGNLEVDFTLPYVWATDFYETPSNFYVMGNRSGGERTDRCEGCTGITDAWLTLKYQPIRNNKFPLVIQGDFKFPEIYRHSNHFIGSRAHDFHLSAWTMWNNKHVWLSPQIGHVWRGGAFADGMTYLVDTGWRPSLNPKALNFYVKTRLDGTIAHNTDRATDSHDRFLGRREIVPGHFFTYNDAEGHRISFSAGATVLQWNVELTYARWLAWRNRIGFKEWTLQFSRPLQDRSLIRGQYLIAAPTQQEVRLRRENSIVLQSGDGFMATQFDWKRGQRRRDDQYESFTARDGRQHDFRFLTAYMAYGLPGGFEVSALVPYLWGREAFEDVNRNFSHTGLNDIWLSVRKQFLYNRVLPLGVAAEFKFPEAIRHADRWLGELKHDIMISMFTIKGGPTWWVAPKFGYKWRQGAFSDELPYVLDAGWRPPFSRSFRDFYVKTLFDGNFSLNNASPAGKGDRFGNRSLALPPDHYFTFNAGAMHRGGFGFGIRAVRNWNVELVNHEYIAWKNNNGYERDWTVSLARFF